MEEYTEREKLSEFQVPTAATFDTITKAVNNFRDLPQPALLATPIDWERDGSIFSASYSSKCRPTCRDNLLTDGLHPQVLR